MKRKFVTITVVTLIFALTFSSLAFGKDMFLGSAFEEDHVIVQMGYEFKNLVEEYTDGEINVTISSGGASGGETQLVEMTTAGSVDGTLTGVQPISLYAGDYAWLITPYIMKDFKAMKTLWEEADIGKDIKNTVRENGNIRLLNILYRGSRLMTSNKKFYTPEELRSEGVKLRLPNIPQWVTVWDEIGANIENIDLTELFSAMQQGVADSTEGPAPQILTTNLYEVQDYLILTNHQVETGYIAINEDYFQDLTSEQQDAIIRAAKEAGETLSNKQMITEIKQIVELQKKGMEVIYPDKDAFLEAAKPAIKEMFENEWEGNYEDVEQYINSF